MKKVLVITFSTILIAAIFYLTWGRDAYYNSKDRTYWTELSSKISESQIEEVLLDYKAFLEGDEFKKFIMDLSKSEYFRSNWRKEGPTGPIVTIKFWDGSKESFHSWGNGIYEISYKKGQFLIQNIELDAILQKYDIYDLY